MTTITELQAELETLKAQNATLENEAVRYRSFFEATPISLWEEDFSEIKVYCDTLRQSGVSDFRTHFRNNPDAVENCLTKLKVLDFNRATLGLFGVSSPTELNDNLKALFGTEAQDVFREEVIALTEGHTTFEAEMRVRTLQQIEKYVLLKLVVAPGHADTWSQIWISMIDITERKLSEAERAQLQQEIIYAQQQSLSELSTPIIPIMDRIIVMPLIGSIDTIRARDILRTLLAGIREHRAKVVILDVTGVPIVDSGVANHLNKTIQAARLKGAHTIVTGISDAVAETIVDLGIDWGNIETLNDLRTGLLIALGDLGIQLSRVT